MATKAQLIAFIMEMFEEPNGEAISKSKLETYKKSDLEEFVAEKNAQADLEAWLSK